MPQYVSMGAPDVADAGVETPHSREDSHGSLLVHELRCRGSPPARTSAKLLGDAVSVFSRWARVSGKSQPTAFDHQALEGSRRSRGRGLAGGLPEAEDLLCGWRSDRAAPTRLAAWASSP